MSVHLSTYRKPYEVSLNKLKAAKTLFYYGQTDIFSRFDKRAHTKEEIQQLIEQVKEYYRKGITVVNDRELLNELFSISYPFCKDEDVYKPLSELSISIISYYLTFTKDPVNNDSLIWTGQAWLNDPPSAMEKTHTFGKKVFETVKEAISKLEELAKPRSHFTPIPALESDYTLNSPELVNPKLDRLDAAIAEILSSEKAFQERMASLLNFKPFEETPYFQDFKKLKEASELLIKKLPFNGSTADRAIKMLEAFNPSNMEQYLLVFVKPRKAFSALNVWAKKLSPAEIEDFKNNNQRLSIEDILIWPIQRALKITLLLQAVQAQTDSPLLKQAIDQRLSYLKAFNEYLNLVQM